MGNPVSARRRELGAELRVRRERARFGMRQFARKLGWSPALLSLIEAGQRRASEVQVAIYLTTLGIRDEGEIRALVSLAREMDDGYHLTPHRDRVPDELIALTIHEAKATVIQEYEPLFVPGLLQTEDYVRALFREGGMVGEGDMQLKVWARLDRQSVLTRSDPARFAVFIHEQALRLPVGELLHLVSVANYRHCLIRMVPIAAGARSGTADSFRLMDIAESDPVVYLEHHTASLFLEKKEDIDAYRSLLKRLATVALDEAESRRLLAELASEYDRQEASHRDERAGQGPGELVELAQE